MIKKSLFSIAAAVAFTTLSNASIVTLSGDATPVTPGGDFIPGGLIRIGTLTGTPASPSVSDIDAVFTEFGVSAVADGGFTPNTFSGSTDRPDAASFNQQQIYIWVFDTPDASNASSHALFSVMDPDSPGEGGAWRFADHQGNGQDNASLTVNAVTLANADLSGTPGASADSSRLVLAPIPEPSGAILAGLAGALLVFRRRR